MFLFYRWHQAAYLVRATILRMKNIWLITIGEPLPCLGQYTSRYLRTGMLAKTLALRGNTVTWWTSSFDHAHKIHYSNPPVYIPEYNYWVVYLKGVSYSHNVSFRRLLNHYQVAKDFERLSVQEQPPNLIYCSYPTIELSLAAVYYGRQNHVPVIIDVRDLWPDIFLNILPKPLSWLGRLLIMPYYFMSKKIFKECDALTAVSENYLDWGLRRGCRIKTEKDLVFMHGYQPFGDDVPICAEIKEHFVELGVIESRTICWFVGTFGRSYDLIPVIEAAKKLEAMGRKDIQFVFSGEGENRELWQRHATGLNNVVFTGWINTRQLTYLLSIADIGLMAYSKDAPQGLPNKIFEYLSVGIPIISCLNGETAAFISDHDCGLSYEPGNSDSFLNALDKTIKSGFNNKHSSRKKYMQSYSSDIIYNQLSTYLENV